MDSKSNVFENILLPIDVNVLFNKYITRYNSATTTTSLFGHNLGDITNQRRPDIHIRNPRNSRLQVIIIIDVALTGVDGQSRTSDEAVERPLQVRYDQKMAKYGQVAGQNDLRLIPAIFSHTGQIHEVFKAFVKEQIRAKLEYFEGPVKSSKVKSHMKW